MHSWAETTQTDPSRVAISMLYSTVLESVLPSHNTPLIREMLLSLQLFGPFFIQNERSWQCPPFQQLLQALAEEVRWRLNYSTIFSPLRRDNSQDKTLKMTAVYSLSTNNFKYKLRKLNNQFWFLALISPV